MGLRIERIEVHSCGPVSTFDETMAPLSVVYAKNEKGKTTIVENTLAALFKAQKDGMYPQLRGDDFVGSAKVTVTGFSKGPQIFTPLNRKQSIDDMLEKDGTLLPRSLFHLLFVRGAETALIHEQGGITKAALKNLVSKQHIFETIRRNIPKSAGYTEFMNGRIVPKKTLGDYKAYEQAKAELEDLTAISDTFYSTLSHTNLIRLTLQKERLTADREELRRAKRSYAYSLSRETKRVQEELRKIDETQLENLYEKVRDYFRKKEIVRALKKSLEQDARATHDQEWIESAQERYLKALDQAVNRVQRIFLILGTACLFPAVVLFFINTLFFLPFLALSFLSLMVTSVFTFFVKKSRTPESVNVEVEQIRREFEKRFGRNLTSTADFAAVKRELEQKLWKRQDSEKQIQEIGSILSALQPEIKHAFARMGVTETCEEKWLMVLDEVKRKRDALNTKYTEYATRLETIGIDESDYNQDPSKIEYSKNREEEIDKDLTGVMEQIRGEEEKLRDVKNRMSEHIGYELASKDNLEKISQALEKRINEYRSSMNDALTTMIAAHVVSKVIEEFKKREDEQLEEYVNSDEIVGLLGEFTGRYSAVYLEEGEEIFIGSDIEKYSLRNLSTGAQEQILLALRMGISKKLSGRESLFLVLDDAFQYSDWDRRQKLIDYVVEIVKNGWQVIYFTMDDDIKNRFIASVEKLAPGDFKMIEL